MLESNTEYQNILKINTANTHLFVHFHVNSLQLAQSNKICADKDPQLLPLTLPFLPVSRVSLMLHPHPQFIHLGEIQQDEINRILDCTLSVGVSVNTILTSSVMRYRKGPTTILLPKKICNKEKTRQHISSRVVRLYIQGLGYRDQIER